MSVSRAETATVIRSVAESEIASVEMSAFATAAVSGAASAPGSVAQSVLLSVLPLVPLTAGQSAVGMASVLEGAMVRERVAGSA